jgi:hypothetical protein
LQNFRVETLVIWIVREGSQDSPHPVYRRRLCWVDGNREMRLLHLGGRELVQELLRIT